VDSVNEELKQVWMASAAIESLQGEMDRAESVLAEAIDEALQAGEDLEVVVGAANLTRTEVVERVRSLDEEPA